MLFKKLLIKFKDITKDILTIYINIILSPIRTIFTYFRSSVLHPIDWIRNLFVLPILNLLYYSIFIILVKNMRRLQHRRVILQLYNEKWYFNEIQRPENLIFSLRNLFKYVLFNKNAETGISPPFVGLHHTSPGFYFQIRQKAKALHPAWRVHKAEFFQGPKSTYKQDIAYDIMKDWRYNLAEAKILESFQICAQNLILLYRKLVRNLPEEVFYYICKIIFIMKMNKNEIRNKIGINENYNGINKNYKQKQEKSITIPIFTMMITEFSNTLNLLRYLFKDLKLKLLLKVLYIVYRILLDVFSKICAVNFFWVLPASYFLNNSLIKLISLGEVPTERSILASGIFGQTGNLYLSLSQFLRHWDMNLVKHDNPYLSYVKSGMYEKHFYGTNIHTQICTVEQGDQRISDTNILNFGAMPFAPDIAEDNLMAAASQSRYIDELIRHSSEWDTFWDKYYPYVQLKEKPYGFSYPITNSKAKLQHLDSMINFQLYTKQPDDKQRWKIQINRWKIFFHRKKERTHRRRSVFPASPRRYYNSETDVGHRIRSRAPLAGKISRHTLEEVPFKDKINVRLIRDFHFRYNIFKVLYSVIGKLTYYVVKFDNAFKILNLFQGKTERKFRSEAFFYRHVGWTELFDFQTLVVLFITLESTFYILYVVNH